MAYRKDMTISTVDMNEEQMRIALFQAFAKHDGDKKKIMKDLDVSMSSLHRFYNTVDFHEILERCGWKQKRGAMRGVRLSSPTNLSMVRNYLKVNGTVGADQFGKLTIAIWGRDAPETRDKIYAALDQLLINGEVAFDDKRGRWSTVA